MAKDPPTRTPALTDFFPLPKSTAGKRRATASSTSNRPPSPRKRVKPDSPTKRTNDNSTAQQNLGEVTLSDSSDDDHAAASNVKTAAPVRDDSEDLVIVEPPVASTSAHKLEEPPKRDANGKGKQPDKVAPIFAPKQRRPSESSASPEKEGANGIKQERPLFGGDMMDLDEKPDVKPSPTKNIAIFDTAAATASSSGSGAAATAGSSAGNNRPLDTPLFSLQPRDDISFASYARVPFSFFTDALVLISSTKSRLYIQLVLTNLLRTVIEHDPKSLESVIYLCSNRIGPSYEPQTELGIGWRELAVNVVAALSLSMRLTSASSYRDLVQVDQGNLGRHVAKAQAARQQAWRSGRHRVRSVQERPPSRTARSFDVPRGLLDLAADGAAQGVSRPLAQHGARAVLTTDHGVTSTALAS